MLFVGFLMFALFLMSGGALIAALAMSRRQRLDLERRIKLASDMPELREKALDLWLEERAPKFAARLHRILTLGRGNIWGMQSGAVKLLAMAVVAGGAIWLLTHSLLAWSLWLAVPLTLLAGFLLPRVVVQREQAAAEAAFTDLFPDAVIAIARMLRAGLPITTAVRSISKESPPPVDVVFATIANQIDIGTPIEDALDLSSREIGLPDFRFFTVAIVLQHLTGGNLAATLEILADIIRRRRAIRLKARATTAEIRVAGYVLGALPFLIMGALLVIQPGYLSPLVTDPRGHILLIAAAVLLAVGGLTMRQMMRSVTVL
jgi:tight adherence protein B